MWWQNAVVYQIYPRSFQDTNGDGEGDLRGIEERLDHLTWLGVDALWLSPIYPSPMADMGYDVAEYGDVDPRYGTLADFDRLLEAAHARGLKLLMDLVPCHSSIEHPWFREHPDRYVWSGRNGPGNNWVATFGGIAWSPDPYDRGLGWYLHSFYPEQPDLDWRNPEVVQAMQDVIRFWIERGVDGFRLDALDRLVKDAELRDDPPASAPSALPQPEEYARLEHLYSGNSPDIEHALDAIRQAAADAFLVGEVYLPTAQVTPYLEHLDSAFAFELFHAPWEKEALASAITADTGAWVLSNHDFPRLATRLGPENVRAAATLLLTLPGTAFVYQGEEIGMADGAGGEPPIDRHGRDGARHPMQWDRSGGFSNGEPWLPLTDPERRNVADQRDDPGSLLNHYRELIALRRTLEGPVELVGSDDGVLAFARGEHLVAINLTGDEREPPRHGEIVLQTHAVNSLPPHGALVARRME